MASRRGTLVTYSKQIIQKLDRDMSALVNKNANTIAHVAKELVPSPGQSRGYATGALRAIIHVEHPNDYEQQFLKAVNEAIGASDYRVIMRDQIQHADPPEVRPNRHAARVVVPLEYADLIERGFDHALSGEYIIGTRYLLSAVQDTEGQWLSDLVDLMKGLEEVHVPTEEEQEAAYNARVMQNIDQEIGLTTTRKQRVANPAGVVWSKEMEDAFRASTPASEFKRHKSKFQGMVRERSYGLGRSWVYTGAMKPVYSLETGGERDQRLDNLRREFHSNLSDEWTKA